MRFTMTEMDAMRPLPDGSLEYSGFANDNIELIQSWQLKDARLWSVLVDQFRNGLDNERARWRSEYWGKLMRGAAMTYSYTQDAELYTVLEDTVRDLLSTQDELGRITSYDLEHEFWGWDIWGRKYVLLGLQHFMEICQDEELNGEITAAMTAHADYIIEHIGRETGKKPLDDTSGHWLAMNSHSILEPMVRLYNHTGDKRYLEFSKYIIDNGGIGGEGNNIFELALANEIAPYQYPTNKAYEMMSCFEGLLEYARVTGEEKWYRAVINFVDKLADTDVTIIGCSGCTHEQLDNSKFTQSDPEKEGLMQETCVTVTWMKLCYQLLRLTGDSKYAEHIERASYNALLGAVNTERCTTNSGFHFDSYSPLILNTRGRFNGGYLPLNYAEMSEYPDDAEFFGCCTAISAAGLALMPIYSVMKTDSGVAINEYFNGRVRLDTARLDISTEYPYGDMVKITVFADSESGFELKLRIPSWSKNTVVEQNGVPAEKSTENGYVSLTVKNGDALFLRFDMRPRMIYPFGENNPGKDKVVAIETGALVLARDARLGKDISEPLDIKADGDGFVQNISLSENNAFSTQICYELISNGEGIKLIDYASAGKTWNEESLMTAWLPITKIR